MKNLKIKIMSLIVLSHSLVFAAEVKSAQLNSNKTSLLIDVIHGGGCGEHKYSLQLISCLESMPVQCTAKLIHETNDFCEAILYRTAEIDLVKSGLSGEYFEDAILTIEGDQNSSVEVKLPGKVEQQSKNSISCVTHTQSQLSIKNDTVDLLTISGIRSQYKVNKVNLMIYETYPSVEEKTFILNDGRSIVTEFRGEESSGTGYFVRLDGTQSPIFKCTKE